MRLIPICLALFLAALSLPSQVFTFPQADSITYAQYMAHDFTALQKTGREALRQDIDFYYLRMRLGISHYEQHEYAAAQVHFEKALEKYPADSVTQEYLYYCYLQTGQEERVNVLAAQMSPGMQQKVGYHKTPLDAVGLEGGILTTGNAENSTYGLGANSFLLGKFSGNMAYSKISVENTFARRLKVYNALAFFSTSTLGKFESVQGTTQEYFRNSNLQYNLGLSWQFDQGWKVAAGAGYYYQSLSEYAVIPPDSSGPPGPPVLTIVTPVYKNISASLAFSKRWKNIIPAVEMSYANFSDTTWLQATASLTYYPLGTPRLYGNTSATGIHVQDDATRLVLSQKVGLRITDHLWAEVSGSYGAHRNYVSSLGFITWNTNDPINWMVGANLKFYLKHFEFTPAWSFQQRQGFYDTAIQGLGPVKSYFNFNNHFINFSVIWNF
jgi:tetratricopeptide (TPR) repeat protein